MVRAMEQYNKQAHSEMTELWRRIDPAVQVGQIYADTTGRKLAVVHAVEPGGVMYRIIFPESARVTTQRVALSSFLGRWRYTGQMVS